MTERCFYCGLFAGDAYKTSYYQISGDVYCSLPCHTEKLRDESLIPKGKENGQQKAKRSVRKTKSRTKRSVASKRRANRRK